MTKFVSSCRNKLTKKYAKKNETPCSFHFQYFRILNETKKKQTFLQATKMQAFMYGNSSKIQFHGVKSVYPVGERVATYFTVPEFVQPECVVGDWIGIFPVTWSVRWSVWSN
jgi:hypothetical protein